MRGISVRANAIRLRFSYQGEMYERRVVVNGKTLTPTASNMAYAERLLSEIKDKIRFGTFNMAEYFGEHIKKDDGPAITVVAFMHYWLDAQRVEESTRAGYTTAINFWKKSFEKKPLASLKHSDVLRAAAKYKDLNGKTLNNYVSILRQALALAVRDGFIDKNPADGVPKYKHQAPPVDPFARDESDRIIEEVRTRYPEPIYNLVEFWFWTGMRTSEIFGLSWRDVDLNKRVAVVSQAKVRGKLKATTKTNVVRTVHLNSRAFEALMRQRKHTQMIGEGVFSDPRYFAEWSDERAFRRSYWTPALKRLGIRYRRPYNMRHSYATAMLMAGMTPAFCAKQLGHSIEMFLRTYTKWIDGAQNEVEMNRLETTLRPQTGLELGWSVNGSSQPFDLFEENDGVADGTRTGSRN